MLRPIISLLCLCIYQLSSAQIQIQGIVHDEHKQPILAATVIELDTENGTITNLNGEFLLSSTSDTVHLEVSYLGYETFRVMHITEDADLEISLRESGIIPGCGITIIAPEILSTQNFTKVDNAILNLNPTTNISEVLNSMPGVTMQSGTYGTNRLTMRGIGSRNQFGTAKILAYWNGIPLTNTRGELGIDDVNLDFVDRASVMRGPTSAKYGSGLGGVLLLNSKGSKDIELHSQVSVGSYGLFSQAHHVSFSGMGRRLDGKVGFGTFKSDGFRQNNRYERQNINGYLSYTAGKKSNMLFSVFLLNANVVGEIPSSLNNEDFLADPTLAASNWLDVNGREDYTKVLVGGSGQYSTVSNWLFKATYAKGFILNEEIRPFNRLEELNLDDRLRISVAKEELFNNNFWFEAGAELLHDNRLRTFRDGQSIEDLFIDRGVNIMEYVELRYRMQYGLSLELGVNAIQHFYKLEEARSEIDRGTLKYQLINPSLRFSRSERLNTSQYISIARGFSPPNSDEVLTSQQFVDSDILPETGWTFEVGAKNYRNKLKYDITAYYMPTANLLVPQRISEEITIGVNAGKTRHLGVEGALYSTLVHDDFIHDFACSASYSVNRFIDFEINEVNYAGNDVTGIAPFQASARWQSSYQGLNVGALYQYRSQMPIDDANSVYNTDFNLVNVHAGYSHTFFGRLTLSATMRLNNILDTEYASMVVVNASSFGGSQPRYFYPGLPRNWLGTLSMKFKIS